MITKIEKKRPKKFQVNVVHIKRHIFNHFVFPFTAVTNLRPVQDVADRVPSRACCAAATRCRGGREI